MEESVQSNPTKLNKVKSTFDKVTSNNSTNWKLVLFWIIVFELISSMVEYLFVKHEAITTVGLPDNVYVEMTVGLAVAIFVWACVYNFIFWSKKRVVPLLVVALFGLYFIVTHDMTLGFLIHNINPAHFFQTEFNFALFIELLFKLIILYLIYQLVISYKNSKKE